MLRRVGRARLGLCRRQAFANVRDVNESPVLALAGLAAIGLLATRLPPVRWRHATSFDLVLATGGPLVLLGLVLGPGIDLINRSVLAALAPVTALAIGWIGATLGARFEWRYVRRIGRGTWLLAALAATTAFLVVALGAWLLGRVVPALSAAWAPRLPAVLTLGAVAAVSGPEVVTLVARVAGVRKSAARAFSLAAALETAGGALAFTLPLALHRPYQSAGRVGLDWLAWLVFAVGSAALIGMVFLSLTRGRPERADVGFALLATLLFGAGVGYAAELSPFLVCALATALIVNASPRRNAVRRVLADWERPIDTVFLVIAGALLTLPTGWLLVAVPLLAAARAAAKWLAVRYGSLALLAGLPPNAGLGTVAQGGAAIALGLNFLMTYGGVGGGGVLTTVVLGVATAQLIAPLLMGLALRSTIASPAAPAPLTPVAARAELGANAPADWPR
ncbi:MAG: hypothetical protein DMD42_05045 [Gemmatimonadetes bacterium]|nr:MAG: hypothetical protein DMD42_05045 [Gemmatimonadota bacterium]